MGAGFEDQGKVKFSAKVNGLTCVFKKEGSSNPAGEYYTGKKLPFVANLEYKLDTNKTTSVVKVSYKKLEMDDQKDFTATWDNDYYLTLTTSKAITSIITT